MRMLSARIRAFIDDARGTVAIEALMLFPVMAWIYLLSFVYFDSFRAKNSNSKAAYTIADAITRESEVDAAYINNMRTMLDMLTVSRFPSKLRVTTITYSAAEAKYEVPWSKGQRDRASTAHRDRRQRDERQDSHDPRGRHR